MRSALFVNCRRALLIGSRNYSALVGSYLKPSLKILPQKSSPTTKLFSFFPSCSYSTGLPAHQIINMPALSPTMTQGNIGTWKKQEGDAIQQGDVLVEIETDKATMDFECQDEGYLAKILVPEGTKDWEVGKPVAVLVEDKADVAAFKDFKAESEVKKVSTTPVEQPSKRNQISAEQSVPTASYGQNAEEQIQSTTPAPKAQPKSSRVIASPVAKILAERNSLDLGQIHGSGPNNRILKHDVLDVIEQKQSAPLSASSSSQGTPYTDIPLTNMRKVIAQRLSESKQSIPHYYLTSDIDMTFALAARKKMNEVGEGKYKLSVNDMIIKASALAMQHVPEVNSSWQDTFIRQYSKVDISVAVATPSGLITPIITDANIKGLKQISANVRELASLAKQNKLRPEQFQGGTFTISNLGMFGSVSSFTAIINPPQSCILAVGGTQTRLVPEGNGAIREAEIMQVTLSCDHRVVDGATGARWLSWLKKYLEEPTLMLL